MWIWIVSLIVLVACFIFAYRMIVSSYDYMPTDKKFPPGFKKAFTSEASLHQETLRALRSKLKSVEDNNSYYEIQFSKFQHRLKALEELQNTQPKISHKPFIDEEDWKEMYYEENDAKEKLENELDETSQKLADAGNSLKEFEESKRQWSGLQSEYDARLNDLQSMQNNMELLQRQLDAVAEREKELEQLLLVEINLKKQYSQLETGHVQLKSETEDLRRQLAEMHRREAALEHRISHVNELESRVAIYEEEKSKIISDLELMAGQNKMFFAQKSS